MTGLVDLKEYLIFSPIEGQYKWILQNWVIEQSADLLERPENVRLDSIIEKLVCIVA